MLNGTGVVGCSDFELAAKDPLELNLAVAKGVPSLDGLDVGCYRRQADGWAAQIKARLPGWEREFRRTPQDWNGNIHLFRLGMACCFVHYDLSIRYKEDLRDAAAVAYTDPADLFLNGVMDTRRGTCANMAALYVALGWRLGWPVSLALAGWHCILRYDDGRLRFNVAATNTEGGFRSHPDDYYRSEFRVPKEQVNCASDLATLTPRQLLGQFVGCRGRHWWDVGEYGRAARDFEAALVLFPESRLYRRMLNQCSYMCSPMTLTVSAWR
jgi:hypothetical protein